MIQESIVKLVQYGLATGLVEKEDKRYTTNKILELLQMDAIDEEYVKQILEHFQIADYFTAIVGSELDGRRTEKAEVIEEALRRMHLEEERDKVLMVGDRSHDVQGAISCGLQCIGVAYGYGSREELEKAGIQEGDTVRMYGFDFDYYK